MRNDMLSAENRTGYFDLLRIIASFAVVVLHVAANGWEQMDVRSTAWLSATFYDGIVRWGVPVFIMISGALFLGKDKTVSSIYKKYVLRIAAAYLVWASFYALTSLKPETGVKQVLHEIIKGKVHLWFMPMIIGLYMITPLLRQMVKNKTCVVYFLILSFIFAIVIPQISETTRIFSTDLSDFIKENVERLNLQYVLGYTFYYVLGYYINGMTLTKKLKRFIVPAGLLAFAVTVAGVVFSSFKLGRPFALFFSNHSVNVCFEAVFIFAMVKSFFEKHSPTERERAITLRLSKWSFGVYLVHIFVLTLVFKYLDYASWPLPLMLRIPLASVLIYAGSMLISAILNKIPFINKYVV